MTHDPTLVGLAAGGTGVGFLVISLFFLKFWRKTRDGLFLTFTAAFALLALVQIVPVLAQIPDESRSSVYLLRLIAFLLIIWAVLRKNLDRK